MAVPMERSRIGPDAPEYYAGALRRYFRNRAHPSDVEDLVQTVLLRMHGRQSETPIDNIAGYIFTVAAHVWTESRTSAAARAIHVELEPADLIDTITPERQVMGQREMELIITELEELPERTRQVFVSHRFEDRTYAALARDHGISVSAIEKLHNVLRGRESSYFVSSQQVLSKGMLWAGDGLRLYPRGDDRTR